MDLCFGSIFSSIGGLFGLQMAQTTPALEKREDKARHWVDGGGYRMEMTWYYMFKEWK